MRRTWIGLALLAVGSLAVLWMTEIPLGIPGEWEWHRIPFAADELSLWLLGFIPVALFGGLYVALAAVGANRLEGATRRQTAAWLCGLSAGGFVWLWAVQESPARPEYATAKWAWVLYYPGTEGYFDEARRRMKDVPSYLSGYEGRMAEGDYLHFGTHPPGLILFHRACLNLCTWSSDLREFLLRTQSGSFRSAVVATEEAERGSRQPITPADRAALWLAAIITQAVATATIVPIYLLVRRTQGRAIGWWTAALWPLIPSLAIFLPKSDALFPFLGAIFLWVWLEGFKRGSLRMCVLAGCIFWLAMFLSLAILPVAVAAVLLTLWEAVFCTSEVEKVKSAGPASRSPRPFDWAARIGAALAAWATLVLVFRLACHVNLLAVWKWNYRNHAAFYEHNQRTWWKWLLANPVELFFAVGAPAVLAAAIGYRTTLAAGGRRRAAGPYWCLTATWLALWLSGKNMGEAARLWLVFMPWPIWMTAGFFAHGQRVEEPLNGHSRPLLARRAITLLLFQMAVCFGTVARVTGFDFPTAPAALTMPIRERMPVLERLADSTCTGDANRR